jgi:nitronate monooxygenase
MQDTILVMNETLPLVIQGGMGVGVSNWRLARAVSALGQLGVVSGAGLDLILARRLQDGDVLGNVRRALEHFPFPEMRKRILDSFFLSGGRAPGKRYRSGGMHTLEGRRGVQELCIAGNFVEVFLAREGHGNPVGINYLEKVSLPHLPSLFGAMLAGASVVIMGAGIPLEVPRLLDAFSELQPADYPLRVTGAPAGVNRRMTFDPREFIEPGVELGPLRRPRFFPIVSSNALATMMLARANGRIDGFIVEGPMAGGHNAPPRGVSTLSESGEPVYGPRDTVDLDKIGDLGLPFWLAGSYGSPERLREALAQGAAGIQVGTAFALSAESGLDPDLKRALVRAALDGTLRIFTDPAASPTGFPFKVARHPGSLSDSQVYEERERICDLGFLREAYEREDHKVGYRCPAEPVGEYTTKGGKVENTTGRRCLCNALLANIGLPQARNGSEEPCLLTLGDDITSIHRFCTPENPEYGAADVLAVLLKDLPPERPSGVC